MAFLNSGSYTGLSNVSSSVSTKAPGKFKSVFITGAVRKDQDFGTIQVMTSVDETGEYLVHNAKEIYFIPYFIKRFWEKYTKAKNQKGEDYDKLVAMSWDDKVPKIDDSCKFTYLISGPVLDPATKKIMTYTKDYEASGIKAGDPILISFKCAGMKFNGAMTYLDTIAKKGKELTPLSESPEFEKNVVTPKRFISKASVSTAKSDYGDKLVFVFELAQQLPDAAVEKILQSAKNAQEVFETQYDKSNQLKSEGSVSGSNTAVEDDLRFDTPAGKEKSVQAPAANNSAAAVDSNFDLGL